MRVTVTSRLSHKNKLLLGRDRFGRQTNSSLEKKLMFERKKESV